MFADAEDDGVRLIPFIEYSRGDSTVDEDLEGIDTVPTPA